MSYSKISQNFLPKIKNFLTFFNFLRDISRSRGVFGYGQITKLWKQIWMFLTQPCWRAEKIGLRDSSLGCFMSCGVSFILPLRFMVRPVTFNCSIINWIFKYLEVRYFKIVGIFTLPDKVVIIVHWIRISNFLSGAAMSPLYH